MKTLSLDNLKRDKLQIEQTLLQYSGALSYVLDNIKKLEEAGDDRERTDTERQ